MVIYKRLVNTGAHIDLINDQAMATPLGRASEAGDIEKATYLLKRGAQVDKGPSLLWFTSDSALPSHI